MTVTEQAAVNAETSAGVLGREEGTAAVGVVNGALTALRDWLPKGRSLPAADRARRHRWLLALLWFHAVALPALGIVRGFSVAHAVLEGAVIAAAAAVATMPAVSLRVRAAITAVGLVTSSAVLVHFSDGLIEAHFHFFVVIILLTLYEDWIPFLIAFGYVVVHHGLVGMLDPESVYNHPDAFANPWKWALIHGAFVAAAGAGGVVSWRLNEESRARAGEAMARAIQSQEANELKSKFIATTSHELRTPLTAISGFATTLIHRWHTLGDQEKVQLLEIIEGQSGRLRHLIEDLLVLSAVESRSVPVRYKPIDVRAVVDGIVSEFTSNGDIDVHVPPGLSACVDERHFTQVVVNYLSNAQKYGAPPITVGATKSDEALELVVSDCGKGVPEAFVPELFESFTRAVESARVEGTGLGLSIVRGLLEAHGGEAWYEANRPRGSVFKARFPQPRARDGASRESADAE